MSTELAREYYRKTIGGETPTEEETDAAFQEDLENDPRECPFIGPGLPGNYWYSKDYEMAMRWERTADQRVKFRERTERLAKVFDNLLLSTDSLEVENAYKLIEIVETTIKQYGGEPKK